MATAKKQIIKILSRIAATALHSFWTASFSRMSSVFVSYFWCSVSSWKLMLRSLSVTLASAASSLSSHRVLCEFFSRMRPPPLMKEWSRLAWFTSGTPEDSCSIWRPDWNQEKSYIFLCQGDLSRSSSEIITGVHWNFKGCDCDIDADVHDTKRAGINGFKFVCTFANLHNLVSNKPNRSCPSMTTCHCNCQILILSLRKEIYTTLDWTNQP